MKEEGRMNPIMRNDEKEAEAAMDDEEKKMLMPRKWREEEYQEEAEYEITFMRRNEKLLTAANSNKSVDEADKALDKALDEASTGTTNYGGADDEYRRDGKYEENLMNKKADDEAALDDCMFEVHPLDQDHESELITKGKGEEAEFDIQLRIYAEDKENAIFAIQNLSDKKERLMKIHMAPDQQEDLEQFEDTLARISAEIFEPIPGNIDIKFHLTLAFDDADLVNLLTVLSNSLLLLARVILNRLKIMPKSAKIRCELSSCKSGNSLALTFGQTFLQNLEAEGSGQFELIHGRKWQFQKIPMKTRKLEKMDEMPKQSKNSTEEGRGRKGKEGGTWLITGGTGGIGFEVGIGIGI
jgi:hypothetical protein